MYDGNQCPLFPLTGLCGFQSVSETPLEGIRFLDAFVQASAIHLYVGDGEHWKHGVLFSEHTIAVPP